MTAGLIFCVLVLVVVGGVAAMVSAGIRHTVSLALACARLAIVLMRHRRHR